MLEYITRSTMVQDS